jgi:hypothetical protein
MTKIKLPHNKFWEIYDILKLPYGNIAITTFITVMENEFSSISFEIGDNIPGYTILKFNIDEEAVAFKMKYL